MKMCIPSFKVYSWFKKRNLINKDKFYVCLQILMEN